MTEHNATTWDMLRSWIRPWAEGACLTAVETDRPLVAAVEQVMADVLGEAHGLHLAAVRALEQERDALAAEVERLRAELEKLANPIGWLQKQAWEQDSALDGIAAVQIENTASWYREAARQALRPASQPAENWIHCGPCRDCIEWMPERRSMGHCLILQQAVDEEFGCRKFDRDPGPSQRRLAVGRVDGR